jgi:hypothetical protein
VREDDDLIFIFLSKEKKWCCFLPLKVDLVIKREEERRIS